MMPLARRLACLFLAAWAVSNWAAATAAPTDSAPAPRPNILVILSDDMGFSDLGCYGSEIATPQLDALAAGGLRFTQFYNTARCCPTRASLLTGLYPHQAAVGHMMEDKGLDGYRGDLGRNCLTMAEVLRPAGYGTYMVGKWHVTRDMRPDGDKHNWPLQRGFDRYYGMINGGGSFYDPATLTRDNTMITPVNDPAYKPERYYFTDALSDNAVMFLREHRQERPEQPFFMYLAYTAAHWPMHALEEDIAKYRGKYDAGYAAIRNARFARQQELGLIDPAWKLSPQAGDWQSVANRAWEARSMEVYAAMIDRLDQGIGRVVEQLRRDGQLDNTLIFFLQDNGGCAEAMGRGPQGRGAKQGGKLAGIPRALGPDEVQMDVVPRYTRDGRPIRQGEGVMPGPDDTYIGYGQAWANVSNTPFREYKHWVHEGGISTPLIVHWPAGFGRRGELEAQPGHLIDIMATCVDVAGASYPETLDDHAITPLEGRSLVPAFQGKPIEREAIYWEHEGNRAVRSGDWKLVAKGPGGPWELYNLADDRTELDDLAAQQPERVGRMVAQWEAWARRARAVPWPWAPAYGEKEALGPKPKSRVKRPGKAQPQSPTLENR